jgi:hypothetical protein
MAKPNFAFGRINYIIMIAGVLILLLGFVVMAADKETYGFGVLGITIGPLIVILGFVTEFVAIFYRPKNQK